MSDQTKVIVEALDYAIQEHGLDDMGFSTDFAAGIVEEALTEAGYAVIPKAAVDKIAELHQPRRFLVCDTGPFCDVCDTGDYPCPTAAALAVSLPIETPTAEGPKCQCRSGVNVVSCRLHPPGGTAYCSGVLPTGEQPT